MKRDYELIRDILLTIYHDPTEESRKLLADKDNQRKIHHDFLEEIGFIETTGEIIDLNNPNTVGKPGYPRRNDLVFYQKRVKYWGREFLYLIADQPVWDYVKSKIPAFYMTFFLITHVAAGKKLEGNELHVDYEIIQ